MLLCKYTNLKDTAGQSATFRHDSVLQHLLNAIIRRKKDGLVVYADLNGWRVNGGTVPHEMALTEQKPDLVIIDKAAAPVKILLVELTVPWDSSQNFQADVERKTARYGRLIEDLREAGFDAYLIFVIFFTLAKFLENKIYTEKRQFFALNL